MFVYWTDAMARLSLLAVIVATVSSEQLVELNHDVSSETPIWDSVGMVPFAMTTVEKGNDKGFWLYMNKFCAVEHLSTHVDAPNHFAEHGWAVDQIPLEHLIVPAAVIDVRRKVRTNHIYAVSAADIDEWMQRYGPFPNRSAVLVLTGWSDRYNNKRDYYGHELDSSKYRFPGFSEEAVKRLTALRESDGVRIAALGIDTPSIDPEPNNGFPAHRHGAAYNIYNIEHLKDLDKLPAVGAELTVMPMKLKGGSGATARVIARITSGGGAAVAASAALLVATALACALL